MFSLASIITAARFPTPRHVFCRYRSQLAPRKMTWIKRQKGSIPIPTGGSTKGTTLAYGQWGIRICGNGARLSAKQLTTVQELIKRKLKVVKGAKLFLRVFPDVPICIKVSLPTGQYNTLLMYDRETKHVWEKARERLNTGPLGAFVFFFRCFIVVAHSYHFQCSYRSSSLRNWRSTHQRGTRS